MEQLFVPLLAALTSLGAFLIGTKGSGLSARTLRHAVGMLLEAIGLGLTFFVANLAVGVTAVFAVRNLTRAFLPLYLADDETLLALSLLQGITLLWWREPRAG